MDETSLGWAEHLHVAIRKLCSNVFEGCITSDHLKDTPDRVVSAFTEYFSGVDEDPELVLKTGFQPGTYNEMVYVKDIEFVSFCAHHLAPFIGKAHFAYLPHEKIVGISKIPRLVEIYSRRPQVQEKLSSDIVDTFMKVVRPKGCGVVIEALHMCMAIRGIKKRAITRTTALRGVFLTPECKGEFLDGVKGGLGWL